MLVLARNKGETIVINGGQIRITVVDVRGDKVRLGLDADPSLFVIHREEVQQAIDAENLELPESEKTPVPDEPKFKAIKGSKSLAQYRSSTSPTPKAKNP